MLDGDDAVEALAQQRRLVRHVHVKDLKVLQDGSYEVTRLGEGHVPWRELFATLRPSYAGWLSFEHERRWHPELPKVSAWLPGELRRLKLLYTATEG